MSALVHASRPRLRPEVEGLIAALPERACIERSVYHQDAARSGLLPLLEGWRAGGLLRDPVDYRDLPGGEQRFRKLGNDRRWRGLSRRNGIEDSTNLAELGDFCRRMGRDARQGEVGLVVGDEYFAIRDFAKE